MKIIEEEILEHFIPQIYYINKKDDVVFKWQKGSSYVEVRIPAFAICKTKPKTAQIIANISRSVEKESLYNRKTSIFEYNLFNLTQLLKELKQ